MIAQSNSQSGAVGQGTSKNASGDKLIVCNYCNFVAFDNVVNDIGEQWPDV